MQPDALIAFLAARLDEDETLAREAAACAEVKDGRWFDEEDEITDDNGLRLATINSPPVTAHIARHDPARVLREVAAERAIITLHAPEPSMHDQPPKPELYCRSCGVDDGWYNVPWPCPTILAVAAIWDDHPDCDPEWKP